MKRWTLLFILCLCITAFAQTNNSAHQSFEYKIEYKLSEKKANELGAQGWELVAMGSTGSGSSSNIIEYVFKRAK